VVGDGERGGGFDGEFRRHENGWMGSWDCGNRGCVLVFFSSRSVVRGGQGFSSLLVPVFLA
jgi:hypothetical protein